jgi:hypothetical protein
MNKTPNILAKMFYRHFDDGEILPGRYACQLNEETYLVVRPDCTTMQVKLGEHIKNAGKVSLDHNNNLQIGRYTIIVGNDPLPDWHALPTNSKTKFHIVRPDGYKSVYSVDDQVGNEGKLTMDENGRIYLNDRNVPIRNRLYELNLLVLPTAKGNGYTAFFNKIMPKDPDNRRNGIPGTFFPGNDKRPSRYCEEGPDGNLYTTVMIRPNEDGRTVRCIMRTLNDAIEEKVMTNDLEHIRLTEAEPYGIDPQDVQEYVDLQNRISENRATMWVQREFSVTNGHRILGLPNAKKKAPEPSI